MIGVAFPKTIRRCLVLFSAVFFLADLADDGKLGATRYDLAARPSHSCSLIQNTFHDYADFDLEDIIFENFLNWQGVKLLPIIGPFFTSSLQSLHRFPCRINKPRSSATCPWHDPYFTGRGCGGLPL